MRYLLDTDTCIYLINERPKAVLARFRRHAVGDIGVSAVTVSELARRGRPIGPLDTMIAAHALSLGTTLVTKNLREFGRIPDLAIENWA